MVLGYYMAFMPLYIEKSGDSDVTIAGRTDGRTDGWTDKQTNEQGKIELLSQWTMDG